MDTSLLDIVVVPTLLILLVASWKIFTKAGQPGWAILIPVYNTYVYTKVLSRPKWWFWLYFSPFILGFLLPFEVMRGLSSSSTINLLLFLMVCFAVGYYALIITDIFRMAKVFGKTAWFGVGLLLLPFIFYAILAFGSAEYDEARVIEGELI